MDRMYPRMMTRSKQKYLNLIFWEKCFKNELFMGGSSGWGMFGKQSIPDHPGNFKLMKGVLGRGLRDSRMVRWGHESHQPKYPGIAPA